MTETQSLIDGTYQLWLKHAPQLYDFCSTHVLEWPSTCVKFLQDSRREPPRRDYSVQQIAVGTNSPGTNYISIYHAFLPCARDEEMEDSEIYSEEDMRQFQSYAGKFVEVAPLLHRHMRAVHDGPVTNILSMPQRPQILATRGRGPAVYLYDVSKRRREPEDLAVRPDMKLKGHKSEGKGMAWNPHSEKAGWLATCASDNVVNIHDLSGAYELLGTRGCVEAGPLMELKGHTDKVEDCSWHGIHDSILISAGYDKQVALWDVRASDKPQEKVEVHRAEVLTVQWHPHAAFLVATGGMDRGARVWDIRKWRKPLMELVGHTDAVLGVKWAPFNDTVLLSYGHDRTVIAWDIAKYNAPCIPGDDDFGRPELLFRHLGHTATVREATWSPFEEDEWSVASVDDNNVLQLWAPNDLVYNDQCDRDAYNTEVV